MAAPFGPSTRICTDPGHVMSQENALCPRPKDVLLSLDHNHELSRTMLRLPQGACTES